MENASKALIMAGSVLIAIVVISLLVVFFNNLRDAAGNQQNQDSIMTASQYNMQYDVYARNVYGTELFSLANKIISNNKIELINDSEFKPVHLYITLEEDLNPVQNYFRKNNKIAEDNDNKQAYNEKEWIANYNVLISLIEELENVTFKTTYVDESDGDKTKKITKTVKEIVNMRTNEQTKYGFTDNLRSEISNGKSYLLKDALSAYRTYKSDLTKIKEQAYRYDRAEYSNVTGRIEEIYYTWVKKVN